MSKGPRRTGLRRELGPFSAMLFTAGMMVGIGIFATFGAATEAAGSGILIAILLGGSVALATGISAAQLGVNNPTEGGALPGLETSVMTRWAPSPAAAISARTSCP